LFQKELKEKLFFFFKNTELFSHIQHRNNFKWFAEVIRRGLFLKPNSAVDLKLPEL
jgi:hypothetical protein